MVEKQVARAGSYDDVPIYALADGTRGAFARIFTHVQVIASDEWTVTHNLGRHPQVEVNDTSGRRVLPEIVHDSLNAFRVVSSAAFSGEATYG